MRLLKIVFVMGLFSPFSVLAGEGVAQIQPIVWQSCEEGKFNQWFGQEEIPEHMQCGYLEVPLSYGDDENETHETVKIAATRLPAIGNKRGSVISISGGPGLAGIRVPFETAALNESYDIIGYDPRGVGQSRPKISCPATPDNDADAEADTASLEKQNAQWVKGCIINTRLNVLKHIGTDEAVNDVEAFRIAMGEDKLSIIAFSYGTQVAQIYAERFPDNVSAMVLDGVVDLTDDAFTSDYKQAQSFQRSFERFAAYCEQKMKCPLTIANATTKYHQLLERVDGLSLSDGYGEAINGDNIIRATTNTLYASEDWPKLARLLRSIESGKLDVKTLAILEKTQDSEVITPQNAPPRGHNRPLTARGLAEKNNAEQEADNLAVIACADSANPGVDIKKSRLKELALAEGSAFSNYPAHKVRPRNICDTWPFKGKLQPHTPAVSAELPPLLFIAQRYDPATPYAGAEAMAKAFNSPLITVEGDGHTLALSGLNLCVDDAVIDYFVNHKAFAGSKKC